MSSNCTKRLISDYNKLIKEPIHGIDASPSEDNILLWNAVIFGPDDTPWEGATFKLSLEFSPDYPKCAPKVKFLSPVFHPNVYADGNICMDILKSQWTPVYTVGALLTSLQSLLADPNCKSPANVEAATLYDTNRSEYEKRVRDCVEKSWVAFEDEGEEIDAENS